MPRNPASPTDPLTPRPMADPVPSSGHHPNRHPNRHPGGQPDRQPNGRSDARSDLRSGLLRSLDPTAKVALLAALVAERPADDPALTEAAVALLEIASREGAGSLTESLRRLAGQPSAAVTARVAMSRAWAVLPREIRAAALAIDGVDWTALAREALAEPDTRSRVSGCGLATEAGGSTLARELASLLDSPSPRVVDAAAAALRKAAVTEARQRSLPTRELTALAAALAAAVDRYDKHRRTDLVASACALLDRTDAARAGLEPLRDLLLDKARPGRAPLVATIRKRVFSGTPDRAWRWMRHRALAEPTVHALAGDAADARSGSTRDPIPDAPPTPPPIVEWHLARHPARAAALRELGTRAERAAIPTTALTGHTTESPTIASRLGLDFPATAADGSPTDRDTASTEENAAAGPSPLRGQIEIAAALAQPAGLHPFVYERGLIDPDPSIRHALARNAGSGQLADLCFDVDVRVARSAAIRWASELNALPSDALGDRARTALALARSADPTSRAIGLDELDLLAPMHASTANPGTPRHDAAATADLRNLADRVWDVRGGLPPRARAAFRRRFTADPKRELAALIADLRSTDDAPIARAVETVRVMRLGDRLAGELERAIRTLLSAPSAKNSSKHSAEQASTTDHRDAALATAVIALGQCPAAPSILVELLDHPNDRVRANAAEALGNSLRLTGPVGIARSTPASTSEHRPATPDPTQTQRATAGLIRALDAPQHRLRANAARALLVTGPTQATHAAEALAAMLSDSRPEHRVAGAWAAGRVVWQSLARPALQLQPAGGLRAERRELVALLADRAGDDPDPRVRARAEFAIRRLESALASPSRHRESRPGA